MLTYVLSQDLLKEIYFQNPQLVEMKVILINQDFWLSKNINLNCFNLKTLTKIVLPLEQV